MPISLGGVLREITIVMYNDLQWLSLILKIDIFFQFIAYILYLLYERFAIHPFNLPNSCLITAFACALLPLYVLCRFSVSLESQFLMVFFILTQIGLFANTIYTVSSTFTTATNWYAYFIYSKYKIRKLSHWIYNHVF